MEHIIRFEQGFDCIKFECVSKQESCKPGMGGSHGRSGLDIRFISKGDEGTVQFLLGTGWLPQFIVPSNIGVRYIKNWGFSCMPFDLGYHSKSPRYEGQESTSTSCEFCDGKPCYCDGSSLNAYDAMYTLVNGGDDALWAFLDSYYNSIFKIGEYPKPAEFKMPLRIEGK